MYSIKKIISPGISLNGHLPMNGFLATPANPLLSEDDLNLLIIGMSTNENETIKRAGELLSQDSLTAEEFHQVAAIFNSNSNEVSFPAILREIYNEMGISAEYSADIVMNSLMAKAASLMPHPSAATSDKELFPSGELIESFISGDISKLHHWISPLTSKGGNEALICDMIKDDLPMLLKKARESILRNPYTDVITEEFSRLQKSLKGNEIIPAVGVLIKQLNKLKEHLLNNAINKEKLAELARSYQFDWVFTSENKEQLKPEVVEKILSGRFYDVSVILVKLRESECIPSKPYDIHSRFKQLTGLIFDTTRHLPNKTASDNEESEPFRASSSVTNERVDLINLINNGVFNRTSMDMRDVAGCMKYLFNGAQPRLPLLNFHQMAQFKKEIEASVGCFTSLNTIGHKEVSECKFKSSPIERMRIDFEAADELKVYIMTLPRPTKEILKGLAHFLNLFAQTVQDKFLHKTGLCQILKAFALSGHVFLNIQDQAKEKAELQLVQNFFTAVLFFPDRLFENYGGPAVIADALKIPSQEHHKKVFSERINIS